jgi:hypothetical protein
VPHILPVAGILNLTSRWRRVRRTQWPPTEVPSQKRVIPIHALDNTL